LANRSPAVPSKQLSESKSDKTMPRIPRIRAPRVADEIVLQNLKFLTLVSQASAPNADKVVHDRYVAFLEARYDQTSNPCYVWDAISAVESRAINDAMIKVARSFENLEKLPISSEVELRIRSETHVRQSHLDLPGWCISHITRWAGAIALTSQRIDQRQVVTNTAAGKGSALNWAERPSLTNEQAADRISSILEFTRKGWNAFDQRQHERIVLHFEQLFESHKLKGLSASRAYAAIAEEFEIEVRSVQRYVTEGRRLIEELRDYLAGKYDKT